MVKSFKRHANNMNLASSQRLRIQRSSPESHKLFFPKCGLDKSNVKEMVTNFVSIFPRNFWTISKWKKKIGSCKIFVALEKTYLIVEEHANEKFKFWLNQRQRGLLVPLVFCGRHSLHLACVHRPKYKSLKFSFSKLKRAN